MEMLLYLPPHKPETHPRVVEITIILSNEQDNYISMVNRT